jgi:hypothetical protein
MVVTWDEASLEFESRYFGWASSAAADEVERDFPMLGRLTSVWAVAFLTAVRSLSATEAGHIVSLYQRRAFPRDASPLSNTEDRDFEMFRRKYVTECNELEKRRKARKKVISTKSLNEAIIDQVRGAMGDVVRIGPGAWQFSKRFDEWLLLTDVETDRFNLGYTQSVVTTKTLSTVTRQNQFAVGCSNIRLLGDISILSWMGLGVDECWDLTVAVDEVDVAQSVLVCCQRFSDALPALLTSIA